MYEKSLTMQIDSIIEKYNGSKERLIQMLLDLQKESGRNFIPQDCIKELAKKLNMPLSKVYEVATFYSMLNIKPKGKYIIEICKSAPCHVRGSDDISKMLEDVLKIKVGETTRDDLFTLQHSSCFGACDISPAIKIEDKVYGNLTLEKIKKIINMYRGS